VDSVTSLPLVEELSGDDLAAMRFLLDRALQPVDRFDGFDWIEQFQTSSVRYQVMGISYALSVAQAARVPALPRLSARGAAPAHRQDDGPPALELLGARERLGQPAPGPRSDGAGHPTTSWYSGWYAAMIGMHTSNTGDDRYERPGRSCSAIRAAASSCTDWPGIVADSSPTTSPAARSRCSL